MYRIIKIGKDVHSKNYTLCAMEPLIGEEDRIFANIQVTADYKNILMFIEQLKRHWGLTPLREDKLSKEFINIW